VYSVFLTAFSLKFQQKAREDSYWN